MTVTYYSLLGGKLANGPRRIFLHYGNGVLGENGEHLEGGSEYTVSAGFASSLVASGRAHYAPERPVAAVVESHDPDPETQAVPEIEVREDAVRRRPGRSRRQ